MRIRILIFNWCVSVSGLLFNAVPDPEFYLMRMRIQVTKMIRIPIHKHCLWVKNGNQSRICGCFLLGQFFVFKEVYGYFLTDCHYLEDIFGLVPPFIIFFEEKSLMVKCAIRIWFLVTTVYTTFLGTWPNFFTNLVNTLVVLFFLHF